MTPSLAMLSPHSIPCPAKTEQIYHLCLNRAMSLLKPVNADANDDISYGFKLSLIKQAIALSAKI